MNAEKSFLYLIGLIAVEAALFSEAREVYAVYVDAELDHRKVEPVRRAAKAKRIDLVRQSRAELDARVGHGKHGGVVAEVGPRRFVTLDDLLRYSGGERVFIVMLDGVEDPFNFGQAVRSLYAAGCHGVVVRPRNWAAPGIRGRPRKWGRSRNWSRPRKWGRPRNWSRPRKWGRRGGAGGNRPGLGGDDGADADGGGRVAGGGGGLLQGAGGRRRGLRRDAGRGERVRGGPDPADVPAGRRGEAGGEAGGAGRGGPGGVDPVRPTVRPVAGDGGGDVGAGV